MNGAGAVEEALRESGVTWRRVARTERGLTVPCAGWGLDIGVAVRGGMVVALSCASSVTTGAMVPSWMPGASVTQ